MVFVIKKINIVLSIGIAILISCLIEINKWYMIYIPILTFIGSYICLVALYFLFLVISSLTIKKKEYESLNPFYRLVFNLSLEVLSDYGRVKVKIDGKDKVPNTPCLFVYNHRSKFDPMIISYKFAKWKIVQISKPENFNIPVANRYMMRNCFLPIDRENAREAIKTINKASDFITQKGYSVGVSPEGTRNHNKELLPFKSGCFKIALKACVPIVVCTLTNFDKIHKNFPWKRTKVNMRIDVIDYEQIKDLNTAEISEIVKEKMEEK